MPRSRKPSAPKAGTLPRPSGRLPVYTLNASKPCKRFCTGRRLRHQPQGTLADRAACGRRLPADRDHRRGRSKGPGRAGHTSPECRHQPARHPDRKLPLAAQPQPSFSAVQDGYHFGYPKGKPGEVHSVLLGHAQSRRGATRSGGVPVVAWAEVSRHPAREGSLGGFERRRGVGRAGRRGRRHHGGIAASRPGDLGSTGIAPPVA